MRSVRSCSEQFYSLISFIIIQCVLSCLLYFTSTVTVPEEHVLDLSRFNMPNIPYTELFSAPFDIHESWSLQPDNWSDEFGMLSAYPQTLHALTIPF